MRLLHNIAAYIEMESFDLQNYCYFAAITFRFLKFPPLGREEPKTSLQ